ncbi:UNVERIFIED_CONTAM: hypothetical protein FKN15_029607 [Acipenser sinensis]
MIPLRGSPLLEKPWRRIDCREERAGGAGEREAVASEPAHTPEHAPQRTALHSTAHAPQTLEKKSTYFVHGGLWLLECVLFTFVLAGRY